MPVSAGSAALKVVPELSRDFSRQLLSQMHGPATRAGDRIGDETGRRFGVRFNKRLGAGFSASTRIARTAASSIAGAFAAVQIAGFLKGAIDEAREAQKVGRQTAAVIKATGGAAKVTAKDVDRLANALSVKAGVDDELIASGANLLLTFKGIRNEAGRGNQIFDQTSAAILDMTAAMNQGEITAQGLKASTIQVGKALNDPIKGITALTRVGVTFTEKQKEQIRTLVESGRTMAAQKIILRELRSEFGGAAKAAADPWKRLGVIINNFKETLGLKLLPVIDRLTNFLTDKLLPRLGGLKKAWDANKDSILALLDPFGDVNARALTADQRAQQLADTLAKLTQGAGKAARALKTVGDFLNEVNRRSEAAGHNLHEKFTRPVVRDVLTIVDRWTAGFHQILRVAATTAEALRLPWAKSLRKTEQMIGGWRRNMQRQIDAVHGKRVKIQAGFGWTSRTFSIPGTRVRAQAAGGPVNGPGTATSDSIPAMLSSGEYVVRAAAVRAVGRDALDQINRQGFAQGGMAMEASTSTRGLSRGVAAINAALGRVAANLEAAAERFALRATYGSGSWRTATNYLSAVGVPYNIISTFRPGARTAATGAVSYHALNRAADLTGNLYRIWRALDRSGIGWRELIYSGAPTYIGRGTRKPIGRLDSTTRANHWDHVHVALAAGGIVTRPTLAMLGERGPEAVVPLDRNGFDYDRLGQAVADALRRQPPIVDVRAIHASDGRYGRIVGR